MRARLLIAALALVLAPSAASAQSILIASETNYVSHPFAHESLPTYELYVIVINNAGLTAVQFAAPLPDCMANATLLYESSGFFKLGSIETGVSVSFGGCLAGDVVVMSLGFASAGIDTCCPWPIVPDPADPYGEVSAVDCGSQSVPLYPAQSVVVPEELSDGTQCGHPTVPSNPSPPDGATDQPLTVMLNWDSQPTAGTGLGVFYGVVYLGTEPDPPFYQSLADAPFEVGPLDAGETYYWKIVSVVSDYGGTEGPVWQFTTTGPTPSKKSTWGAIKALYRE